MKNQIQIDHEFFSKPDSISISINNKIIYSGEASTDAINFVPEMGTNVVIVSLNSKANGNFFYDDVSGQVTKNSKVKVREIIVENRYFRSLVIKCGLVEVDLCKNLSFPSKYIDHENTLTMEGSQYLIKFDYPIKNWMQIHRHGRDLSKINQNNQHVKHKIKELEI